MLLPLPEEEEEERNIAAMEARPSPASTRVREPGKRRARRKAQLDYILREFSTSNDNEDSGTSSSYYEPREDFKNLIQNEEMLRKFLNGGLPLKNRRCLISHRRRQRGPPRFLQAQARWLQLERGLRSWFRRYALRNPDLIEQLEQSITSWIDNENQFNNEPLAFALQDAPDRRLIYTLAKFHGCQLSVDHDFLILARPRLPNTDTITREGLLHQHHQNNLSVFDIIQFQQQQGS
mmetsp:Transcript_18319/g.23841  ORF Transcript_18319/g.23841 Transcript_18319/m.23841 type:complete len:235 (-) Transcript_18319:805-1509(-)|eukprot:CAMPEP_0197298380 /NCGR_PEP_ID=MMETSP0890-20130614/43366_1 /TAXON_ID=44058 ORGANISM="Aureoumbra lagunensis, Strain CCMP1510" /NCGR_SAMPLE_ID=MMETSP0890 /ASSEMBLY_ACC=CAM_ASM_000533 /LENGTH=234 /DNA_ID=CAMNT_0042776111 /DNA_START=94 /DNA_END=798 /DNA_ORIENTATION=+